jgi:crossover junction endodeoxyribonuclease RuvC
MEESNEGGGMLVIGIDPGQTGAIAAMWGDKVLAVKDMPVSARLQGKGNAVNTGELASILMEMRVPGKPVLVVLEAVHAMPGQGVSSSFNFGDSVGAVRGVVGALQYPLMMVTPQKWKKRAGLIGKDKDAARTLAINRHPQVAHYLKRKKDGGRADAICIAEFGHNK